MDQYRIFISHFSQEEPIADAIQRVLKRAFVGHAKVFISSNIAKGTNWLNQVRERLLDADEVLTVFSFRSADRPWLNIETGFGVISGRPVTPILFNGFHIKDLAVVFQLHQAVDWEKETDVCRLFADIHARICEKNPDAESRWSANQFWNHWKKEIEQAVGKTPKVPRRANEQPVVWLMGSHSELKSKREQETALQVAQVIAKVCVANHIQIVSGTSRLLEYLADEYENYREYFMKHPDQLAEVKGEPFRKAIASEQALNPSSAPNPIILLGSLRHKGARATFDDAIGRFPDIAILIGGRPTGRSTEEERLAQQAGIPLLPLRFTGGAAASARNTLSSKLDLKVAELQSSFGRIDRIGRLIVELIKEQIEISEEETKDKSTKVTSKAREEPPGLSERETELLMKINQGLPHDMQERLNELIDKRQAETISAKELRELKKLTDQVEKFDVERLKLLTELAALRQVPLRKLIKQFGLKPVPYD